MGTANEVLLVYTDGAARGNPGPAAIAYAIFNPEGDCIEKDSKTIGARTNNQAEYEAMIWAIERVARHDPRRVLFHSDSEVMIRQIDGRYKIKNEGLRERHETLMKALNRLPSKSFKNLRRDDPRIQFVDELVNLVLDECT
jgi:ribonuclease HI